MKYEIPQMLKQGGGAIVNTASVAGLIGLAGRAAYVASKHGVVGITRTAVLEYAQQGIRVNCVCPGYIRTPMVAYVLQKEGEQLEKQMVAREPIGRLGTPGCSSATTLIMNRLKFGGQKFSKCPNMIRQSGGHARGLMAPLGLDQSRGM